MALLETFRPIAFVLTRDRATSLPFYRDTLGLRLTAEDDFAAVFDLAGTTLRLTTVENHAPSGHVVLGWQVPEIAATVWELSAKGITFTVYPGLGQDELGIWTSPDGRTKVAFFADPEGNMLSLTEG